METSSSLSLSLEYSLGGDGLIGVLHVGIAYKTRDIKREQNRVQASNESETHQLISLKESEI